ncbi:MAG: hypothetical protein OEM40_05630 [Acidimicrobiia bacterium]|nr:hypothetical protein [Acidimicrobiia bacterium]MDH5505371.1 hypothetical protein [Acidimicrobiia bacterium]
MSSNIGLLLGWMLVTVTAIGVTSAAVESVRANVTDSPAPAFVLQNGEEITREDIVSSPQSANQTVSSSTTIADPSRETFDPPAAAAGDTTAVVTDPSAADPIPSASAEGPTGNLLKTYILFGGSVTVSANADSVTLLGAVPNSGFSATEERRSDPTKVVVEFESNSHKSTIEIRWSDGELKYSADEQVQD